MPTRALHSVPESGSVQGKVDGSVRHAPAWRRMPTAERRVKAVARRKTFTARKKLCPAAMSIIDCFSCTMPWRMCSRAWVRSTPRRSTTRRHGTTPGGFPSFKVWAHNIGQQQRHRGDAGGSSPDDNGLVRYAKPALQRGPAVRWRHSVVGLVVPQLSAASADRQRGAAHCGALLHTTLQGSLFWLPVVVIPCLARCPGRAGRLTWGCWLSWRLDQLAAASWH
jgi:hypothetical protein